ncbi:MAG TPA: hypothetical protein VGS17_06720 [Candidatus Limnocylindria bacterium]|nr:hypothetical protein [Candidatus Limnocylindria bacterium]
MTAPVLGLDPPRDSSQAPRYVSGRWSSTLPLLDVALMVTPEPAFACTVAVDPGRQSGAYGCDGLLPPATDIRLELTATSDQGVRARATRSVRTMADRLSGVPWFTEFEDPNGEALACAAASVRIIQTFTTGRDVATAGQVLLLGRPLNKSADPGIDPAAIAAAIAALEPGNRYHYYRFATSEAATHAAVYWLARSAKPVIALSLAGQHAPIITGYTGTIGPTLGDPANITGLVVEDPQRGDLDPATAKHRPDKSRSAAFQTGKVVGIDEWYTDDWWFRDAYKGSIIFNSDARLHDVDRNDNVYPKPHWDGMFVILVDDGDTATPVDREGQVRPK